MQLALILSCLCATASAFVCAPLVSRAQFIAPQLHRRASVHAAEVNVGSIVVLQPDKGSNTLLAAITAAEGKKKWRVVTSDGRSLVVAPRAIQHICRSTGGQSDVEKLEAAATSAASRVDGPEITELWEFVSDEGDMPLQELGELLLSDGGSDALYATYRLLTDSPMGRACFSAAKNGETFAARPADEMNRLRAQAEAETAAVEAKEQFRARVDAACATDAATTPFDLSAESDETQAAFAALARLGCRARTPDKDQEAEETDEVAIALLQQLSRKATPESARQLMVQLGLWGVHEDLELIRRRVPVDFSEELVEAAAAIVTGDGVIEDADAGTRLDLTHLDAFAIDEERTKEVDDAISIEVLGAGGEGGGGEEGAEGSSTQRLWIHIADPSRFVAMGSPLDLEARRRGSSVYLPTGTIPMFPLDLAAGPLSLSTAAADAAPALSVGVMLTDDGAMDATQPITITPSLVRARRLTYLDVDALLGDPFTDWGGGGEEAEEEPGQGQAEAAASVGEGAMEALRRLEWASSRRLAWRVAAGAAMDSLAPEGLPDAYIHAEPHAECEGGMAVSVREGGAQAGGVARRIVTEMMLLAGEAVATYARDHSVPLPFRGQLVRNELTDEQIDDCPPGPCRAWLAIKEMRPGTVSPTPTAHEGLGLDAYVQMTSPIRRYPDLAVHQQLKARLRGEPLPYPADDAESNTDGAAGAGGSSSGSSSNGNAMLLTLARESGRTARQLERSANAYWLSVWLKRHAGESMEALCLGSPIDRRQRDVSKLLLKGRGVIVDCKPPSPLPLGARVEVAPNKFGELILRSVLE